MEISFKMQIQFGAGAGSRYVEAEKIWKLKNPNFAAILVPLSSSSSSIDTHDDKKYHLVIERLSAVLPILERKSQNRL